MKTEESFPLVGPTSEDDPRVIAETSVVVLQDGTRIRIRPVLPGDRDTVRLGFQQLSTVSRTHRFFTGSSNLSDSLLDYLTNIDHANHVALIAFAVDALRDAGVGIARYVRSREGCERAEVAVTTVDAFQHRGVASALLLRLSAVAARNGITTFDAVVQRDNAEALGLARKVGAVMRPADPGVVGIEIPLDRLTALLTPGASFVGQV